MKYISNIENAFDIISVIFDSLVLNANLVLVVSKPEELMMKIMSKYKVIEAAGGYVRNSDQSLLMIHRRGFWDLPKGKVEVNEVFTETAMREVEEECGVNKLVIDSEPFITYHLYRDSISSIIKKSYWYSMRTGFAGELAPQTEEDIEKAEWVNVPVDKEKLNESYSSIREVMRHFFGT